MSQKRSKLLDYASTFLNGLTGKRKEVAEGVDNKTERLYNTYGSKKKESKNEQSKESSKSSDSGKSRISSDDPWFAYSEEGRKQRGVK